MLKFSEFLKEDFLVEGKEVSHRGTLNEIAMVNAFERYNQLKNKHNGDHYKAIQELANEPHIGKIDNPYTDTINKIAKDIGQEETNRTLWDSHHAAIAAMNHIHEKEGGIAGPAEWTGGDVSGETVRKITGVNSNADILIPTGSGDKIRIKMGKDDWRHGSLKYSKELKDKPTKLFQGNAKEMVDKIQKHHMEHFGKRDSNLDNALDEMQSEFGDVSSRLEKHSDALAAAGFEKSKTGKNKGLWPASKGGGGLVDQARYAATALSGSKDAGERRKQIESYLRSKNIPEQDFEDHIKNLAEVHNTIKGNKDEKSSAFMDAVTNALNRSYNEAPRGQNALLRDLLNIRERRRIKSLVIKTQRNDKIQDNYEGNPRALPKVGIANHGNDMEALFRRGLRQGLPENKLLLAKSTPDTASATLSKTNGKPIARFSVDQSGSSPSVIAQAGSEIDNFKDVSNKHPMHLDYTSVTPNTTQKHPEERGSGEHGPVSFAHPDDPTHISNKFSKETGSYYGA